VVVNRQSSTKSRSDAGLAYVVQRTSSRAGRGIGEGRERDGGGTGEARGAGGPVRAGLSRQGCAGGVGLHTAGRAVVVGGSDPRRGIRGGTVESGGTTTWVGR